jgi:hypothetical protein
MRSCHAQRTGLATIWRKSRRNDVAYSPVSEPFFAFTIAR